MNGRSVKQALISSVWQSRITGCETGQLNLPGYILHTQEEKSNYKNSLHKNPDRNCFKKPWKGKEDCKKEKKKAFSNAEMVMLNSKFGKHKVEK